ncbi:pyridoxal 5'-phosphate synthase glutaminase subunit PdxT [Faecalimicrobium sp. JNUCC 81]
MNIGVLAMQGAYREHINMLKKLGTESIEIRNKEDFENIDGIIIPGGESTAIGKLLKTLDLHVTLKEKILSKTPVWGTCAGMILLAKEIKNDDVHIGTMDIEVVRNGYGRQLGSFNTEEKVNYIGDNIPMVFIRAPYIKNVGAKVEVLSKVNGKIVAAKENNMLVTSFHPELTDDLRVHKYFLDMVKKRN